MIRIDDHGKILSAVLELTKESDKEKILDLILEKMMILTKSDAGTLYIRKEDKLFFHIMRNNTFRSYKNAKIEDIGLPPIMLDKNNIQNVSAYVALTKESVLVQDVYNNSEFNFDGPKTYDNMTGYKTRNMLVYPVYSFNEDTEQVSAVLQLINATDPNTGTELTFDRAYEDLIIKSLVILCGNILTISQNLEANKNIFQSFVSVMTHTIDQRNRVTSNHTKNVVELCTGFAEHMNFSSRHKEAFIMSAWLHDIGKIVTPIEILDKATRLDKKLEPLLMRLQSKKDQLQISMLKKEILEEEYQSELDHIEKVKKLVLEINAANFISQEQIDKVNEFEKLEYIDIYGQKSKIFTKYDIECLSIEKGTLTKSERRTMEEHVVITEELLEKIDSLSYYKDMDKWASSHHELLDGTGYPKQLKGNEIPKETRMMTICDIFEALTSGERPYKKPFSLEKALGILVQMADEGKLDKELVKEFEKSKAWERIQIK